MTPELVEVGQFCPNETCESYGDVEQANIIRFGQTAKGIQRFRCKVCGKTFVETTGTLFYGKQSAKKDILETLALLAEEVRISSISRAEGHKEDTILAWLRAASHHAEQIEAILMKDYQVSQAQINGLWAYVGHKGQKGDTLKTRNVARFWRCTLIGHDTRLQVGRGLAKTEIEASQQALSMLKKTQPVEPAAWPGIGWLGGHREALVEVYGQVPPRKPGRGRPPTKKQSGPDWQYLQMVKQRENGCVIGMGPRVIYENEQQVLNQLSAHTAYVERTHLTTRHMNGRLVRKTFGFSKKLEMLTAFCIWEDVLYNFTRHVRTLSLKMYQAARRWLRRSSAVVAGITDHLWSIEELLTLAPIPDNT